MGSEAPSDWTITRGVGPVDGSSVLPMSRSPGSKIDLRGRKGEHAERGCDQQHGEGQSLHTQKYSTARGKRVMFARRVTLMRRAAACVFFLLVLLVAGASAWAEGSASPWVFDVGLRLWGLDLGVGYRGWSLIEGMDTTLWVYGGGAWEKMTYYRVAETMMRGEYTGGGDPEFYRADGNWQLGIEQGLLWNDRISANRLEAQLFYRGRYNDNLTEAGDLILGSGLPDAEGILLNTFFLGLAYNDVLFDKNHKMKSGISAEVSAEYGPGFLLNTVVGRR